MKNKTNTYLILAIVLAGGSVTGLWYFSEYVNGLTEKTSLLKEQVETQELKIRRDQILSKSAQNTNIERQQLASYFIKQNASIDFISSVENTASNLGLSYNTNQIDNSTTENLSSQNKELLKISMTVSGKWSSVIKFLRYIETMPYSVKVEKVYLSTDIEATAQDSSSTVSPSNTADKNAKVAATPTQKGSSWKLQVSFSVIKIKDDAQ